MPFNVGPLERLINVPAKLIKIFEKEMNIFEFIISVKPILRQIGRTN